MSLFRCCAAVREELSRWWTWLCEYKKCITRSAVEPGWWGLSLQNYANDVYPVCSPTCLSRSHSSLIVYHHKHKIHSRQRRKPNILHPHITIRQLCLYKGRNMQSIGGRWWFDWSKTNAAVFWQEKWRWRCRYREGIRKKGNSRCSIAIWS